MRHCLWFWSAVYHMNMQTHSWPAYLPHLIQIKTLSARGLYKFSYLLSLMKAFFVSQMCIPIPSYELFTSILVMAKWALDAHIDAIKFQSLTKVCWEPLLLDKITVSVKTYFIYTNLKLSWTYIFSLLVQTHFLPTLIKKKHSF